MRADQEACRAAADALYDELQAAGVEVIYDDRDVHAGTMFADADLLGVPVRVIVGPKNLKNGRIELVSRDKRVSRLVDTATAVTEIEALINDLFAEINEKVEKRV